MSNSAPADFYTDTSGDTNQTITNTKTPTVQATDTSATSSTPGAALPTPANQVLYFFGAAAAGFLLTSLLGGKS